MLTAAAVAASSLVWMQHAQRRLAEGERQLAALARSASAPAPQASAQVVTDFTASLGPPPTAASVVEELKRVGGRAGCTLVSVQSQEHMPAVDRLAILEMTVVIRGPYAGVKETLAHLVDRFPAASISRLRLARVPNSTDTEMTGTMAFWGAPLRVESPGTN